MKPNLFLAVICVVASQIVFISFASADKALLQKCSGPSVEQVIKAALARENLGRGKMSSWSTKLGWSAFLPKVSARVSRSLSTYEDRELLASSLKELDQRYYYGVRWSILVSWDLSRLLFDSRELQISDRVARLAKERRMLIDRVVLLYFERCHLLVMSQTGNESDQEQALTFHFKLLRITAILNALTGGLFDKKELRHG